MRLLHFDHSDRLVLTDFRGKPVPPYAILSHRWEDSEIIFQDIGSGTYQEKSSYRKLLFCAKQAALDGLQYFWIDTCCIDKYNIRELSRAINSMYLWYKEATKCYVFLSDVSASAETAETHQQRDWEASFRASKWFTRGWTLQELIAPVSVEFFSCEGQRIGDKRSLEQLVHEITRIPLAALRNCPLDQFTKLERMQWAENRHTTEEEDKVYCLLGVLDISMPVSYGKGREDAIKRLRVELEAASSAPSIIPFSRNENFVGRELQLAELEAKLFSNRQTTTTTLAIVGPGGTGKSQLALELAYKTKEKNKNCSVFWIDAGDIDSLYQSYTAIAQKLDVPGWDDEQADVKQLVKLHLEGKGARQYLLIFDNIDMDLGSSRLYTTRAADSIDYLPQSELCSVVFTTTDSHKAKILASQNVVELQGMTPDTAQRMLENYLSTSFSRSEQREANLLLQELSYLPLAIIQAAAYIKSQDTTLQKYRSLLDEQKEQALQHNSRSSEDTVQGHGAKDPVAATLFMSIDQIRRNNALAVDYLYFAACVDRKDVLLDLFEAPSHQESVDAIKALSSYALVTRRPADSALDLHRLVHHALQEWLQKQNWLGQWTQHAIIRLLRVFPDNNHIHSSRSKWRRLHPHVKRALSHSLDEPEDQDRQTLILRYSLTLFRDGRYNEAEGYSAQLMETRKRVLGEEHLDTLGSMDTLASIYRRQGQHKEAEGLGVQVLEIRKRVLGEEHPDTLTSMANLASTYRSQGRWKDAEELQAKELRLSLRVLGEEHPDTLISMDNLASMYWNLGRWREAEELGVQVLEIRKRVLGEDHPDMLTTMANLASTYKDQRRWKEAEELQVQAIGLLRRVFGEEHPDTMTTMGNLSITIWSQGRWKEAKELGVQVLEMRKTVLGKEHPNTLASMISLIVIYREQGQWKEAEELGVQAIETCKRVLGREHPDTLSSMANLALIYSDQGRWKKAEELEVQVLETRKRVLGKDHPHTLATTANLALTYRSQGQWKEAEELQVQVIELLKSVHGEEHPDTLTTIGNLGLTYSDQGRWKEAEELFAQAMDIGKKVLGEEHPDTMMLMANLAFALKSQSHNEKAISLMESCMQLRKRVLGSHHPNTEFSLQTLTSWQMEEIHISH